ncbi:molybdenum cofactor guanylyltransferase [Actinocorallia sp. API 0066]|uniref:molybdenum cofactor guanylyltransferase n=1 Tax=Actinocorallia sp. API 0066 TaxID=2896846 RepID=UPI001E4513EE|nr:molybdenum cofactor guanylyltransferase [Actinocorallia sp. API 0066]MCD0450192.1 molybdenum cofactor guanylyltransferase [Actinocorallia sp. API 0066]
MNAGETTDGARQAGRRDAWAGGPRGRAETYDAVILAGGAARRFGGTDKPGALVGGRPLIVRVADAVADASRTIIVGPVRPGMEAVFVHEDPPGSGPVPALRAGLQIVVAPRVVLLAADLPFLTQPVVAGLLAHRNAVLVDAEGRDQWLTGAWHTDTLRSALESYRGASLRGLLHPLRPVRVAAADHWTDCDTPADLARAEERLT